MKIRGSGNEFGRVELFQPMAVRLLVVEAEGHFRRTIAERLRQEKYRVTEVCQEEDARGLLQRKDIDVVLLGTRRLNPQRGIALLKTMKEIRPLTEFILMTGPGQLPLSIEGMKLGAFDDLLVPFDMETLLERVRAACERKVEREKARRGNHPAKTEGEPSSHSPKPDAVSKGQPGGTPSSPKSIKRFKGFLALWI